MADNRQPRQREKNVTGQGNKVARRGEGTGSGPVGQGSALSGNGGNGGSGGSGGGASGRAGGSGLGLLSSLAGGSGSSGGGGKGGLIIAVIAIVVLLLGGGKGLGSLLGGGGDDDSYTSTYTSTSSNSSQSQNAGSLLDLGSLAGSFLGTNNVSNQISGWTWKSNTGKLDKSVDKAARDRYTTIRGNGKDTVTIMVYMCGTDLESKYGMATNDIVEMQNASLSDKVNLILFTGGCKKWKNDIVSNSKNQIYKIEDGQLYYLERDAGTKAMTDPSNLTYFIDYCTKNYKADRNMLIFWDHGGGSISGYGYDEKNQSAGSMSLSGINKALSDAKTKFDFIGFDACLMATLETDLMAAEYADYMIASEETEPGVGWYYTNWLTALSKDTSMPTIEIGKMIADDFVAECYRSCGDQKTTLSVVDLAELSETVTDDLKKFSRGTTELIKDGDYKVVSDARSNTREFATSSKIDQIDLYSFAKNIGTKESEELAESILSAVKYNKTSDNMPNSYGISIYFPYRKSSKVNSAIQNYDAIGMDSSYGACIKEFAGLELSGQAASGGDSLNPLSLLLGSSSGASNSSSMEGLDSILSLVSAFSGGSSSSNMLGSLTGLLTGRSMTDEDCAAYIEKNQFDNANLNWVKADDGYYRVKLTADQWSMVHSVDLNVFVDDGSGFIDMGLDNSCTFDKEGNLLAGNEGTWLAVGDQPVAYYHTDTADDGDSYTITGYIPALLNGERVKLIVAFTDKEPYGKILGADLDYDSSVTETKARGLVDLQNGDKIDFLADYYSYEGNFVDSYRIGEQVTVNGELVISDKYLDDDYIALYKFTDIYNQSHWTNAVPKQ